MVSLTITISVFLVSSLNNLYHIPLLWEGWCLIVWGECISLHFSQLLLKMILHTPLEVLVWHVVPGYYQSTSGSQILQLPIILESALGVSLSLLQVMKTRPLWFFSHPAQLLAVPLQWKVMVTDTKKKESFNIKHIYICKVVISTKLSSHVVESSTICKLVNCSFIQYQCSVGKQNMRSYVAPKIELNTHLWDNKKLL